MLRAKAAPPTIVLYAALVLLAAFAVTYRIRDTIGRAAELVRYDDVVRLPFSTEFPLLTVESPQPEAIAAGLEEGARIVTIDGEPLADGRRYYGRLANARPGDELTVEIVPPGGGDARTVTIALRPLHDTSPGVAQWLFYALAYIALPYLCLVLGFWVAAVRIRDRLAWIVLLLLLSLAEFGSNWRTLGLDDWFQPAALVYQTLLAHLWPVSMLLFGVSFPEPLPLDRRKPWLKWLIIGPILAGLAVALLMLQRLLSGDVADATRLATILSPLIPIAGVMEFAAIAVFFAALGYRAFTERRPDARRRLMLLHWSGAIAITPLCVVIVLVLTGMPFREWMVAPLLALLLVFPAAMAYVIVVERALDVRVVVRQGIQYLLARGSVRVVQIVLSTAIAVYLSVMNFSGAMMPISVRILLVVAGVLAIVAIGQLAERVRRWVDRRFFRDAYQAEQILSDLATRVRTMVEARPLLETVAHQIAQTLHVPRVAILLNGGHVLEPAYALGYGTIEPLPLSGAALTPEHEAAIRQRLEAELVLPLSANQKLVGVLGLGPKRSEEPFTSADIRLLDAVATQTGFALENSRLTAEIAAEIANREKAAREIEIAREVQERLFPQHYPPVPGLEYAGLCRPALGIGGDYYDFIALSETEIGIAIGDVSGKGMPAALLMATLRAYLRGQTIRGQSDLAVMIGNLDRLVYESSAPNRYATFFYGEYDATTRTLRYVNAGHNPPVLVRSSGEVVRLATGGPVVGLLPECHYQQGCTTLQPGDLLVGFTDGVSEAMDAQMREWGEDQLVTEIEANRSLPPKTLIDSIIQRADAFAAGAPQYDDMTLVVIRACE